MNRDYGWRGILVLPDDLIAFAWSAPMRELAPKIGISDVALRKLFVRHGVPPPPQGHWNRVYAGKAVQAPPKCSPRRPGETGRLLVDARFNGFVQQAEPMPSRGPFASTVVPEDLEELRAKELKAIGTRKVSRTLDLVHPGLKHIVAREGRRRQKVAESSWGHWDEPRFDGALDQRRLRLLNAIFLSLAKRGHGGDANEIEHEIHPRVKIGDTYSGFGIDIAGQHRTLTLRGQTRPAADLPANTPLVLRIRPEFDHEVVDAWADDADGSLESKIASITAALIVAGEAKFRLQLRKDEERAERERMEREAKAEQARLARELRLVAEVEALNRERIANLQQSGELLRQAADIRSLVVEVRRALTAGGTDVDPSAVDAWEQWALQEADNLDPVLSGQFLSHLHPPLHDSDEFDRGSGSESCQDSSWLLRRDAGSAYLIESR